MADRSGQASLTEARYLCVVLDLYSRRVVGRSVGKELGVELAMRALLMATLTRRPPRGPVLHTGRGVHDSRSPDGRRNAVAQLKAEAVKMVTEQGLVSECLLETGCQVRLRDHKPS